MARPMQRSQIQFSDGQLSLIRRLAAVEGISIAEVVRRAVEQYADHDAHRRENVSLRSRAAVVAGRYASGQRTIAADHDDQLADAFRS